MWLAPAIGARSEQPSAQAELDEVISAAATYAPGKSMEPFRKLEQWRRQCVSQPALREQLERGLVKLLGPEASFGARRFACKQLGIIGDESALPALERLLQDDETVGIACLALTTYPRGGADDLLRAALESASGKRAIQIVNILGDRRDKRAVGALARLAAGRNVALAEAVVASLGKIADPAARKAIASLRKSADPALESALIDATLRCAEQLAADGDRKAATAVYEELLAPSEPATTRRSAFSALLRLDKDHGEQRILSVLYHADGALIPAAIAAIPSARPTSGSEKFARQLHGLEPEHQVLLIDSLAACGDEDAISVIAGCLASPEPAVRCAAYGGLSRAGDMSCVPLLGHALANASDADERHAIETALVQLGGGTATEQALRTELNGSSGEVRVSLLTAISKREGAEANRLMLVEASSPNPLVAKAAFRALGRTATPAIVPDLLSKLVEARRPDVRAEAESAAAQALMRIESVPRRSALVREALDRAESAESRGALLGLLPVSSDEAALASLKSAAASPEAPVRDAAVRALAEWPEPSAWETLAAIYRNPQSETLRGLALRGLVRLAGEGAAEGSQAERYRVLLEGARSDDHVKLILGALSGVADPAALQLAVAQLDKPGVHAEAEAAVKKIAEAIKAKHPKEAQEALDKLGAGR
jgi:HEAT repeat protein